MRQVFLVFIILFLTVLSVYANPSYDSVTNTITLDAGAHTLDSIYNQINGPSVLAYDSATNTYTLSANIVGGPGPLNQPDKHPYDADLVLENATLVIKSTTTSETVIQIKSDLKINNMIIKAEDSTCPWRIHGGYSLDAYPYGVEITDSDFSGGHIIVKAWGSGAYPRTPVIIKNNKFHDISIAGQYGSEYILSASADKENSYNNTFENVHITAGSYNGIVSGKDWDKLYISNCSVNSYGAVYYAFGLPNTGNTRENAAVLSNFEIKDCVRDGITGKEWGNVIIRDGTIRNVSGDAIHTYRRYNPNYFHKAKYYIWNVSIEGASRAIATNWWEDWNLLDIYDVKISNAQTVYRLGCNDIFYVTNTKISNYTTKYSGMGGGQNCPGTNTEVREYELADIKVLDANNNPAANAAVTIAYDNPDSDAIPQSVNRIMPGGISIGEEGYGQGLQEVTQTYTLANGHTPLPAEDEAKTIALLRNRKTVTAERSDYTYTITAEKDGKTASLTGLDIDESWYRENPEQPTKTVVLNIDTGAGYVETNYIIDLDQNGVINILDIVIVAQHFGETTTSPYPSYDVNSDGSVDILDIRLVAEGM